MTERPPNTIYKKPYFRRQGFQSITAILPRVTKKVFERYGFSTVSLITQWDSIVGADLAAYSWPEKVNWPRTHYDKEGNQTAQQSSHKGHYGATLHLGVEGHRALDVEYQSAQILEKINQFFGYRAITNLRIIQISPDRHNRQTSIPEKITSKHTVEQGTLEGIEDEDLLKALRKLGENRK